MKILKKLFLILLLVPISVSALNVQTGDDVDSNEEIVGSSFIAGNNVSVENKVEGINILLGNNIDFKGNSDYLVTFGNNVTISGNVNNDSFIFGNIITFDENTTIKRDLIIFGNEVIIDGKIERDITVYANMVKVSGEIKNINIKANEIEIVGQINGKLEYNEDAIITKDDNLINEIVLTEKLNKEISLNDKILNFIYSLGGTLVIFLALYFIAPQLFKKIEDKNENITVLSVFSLFGFGALSLILIPAILIILFSLVFGFSLAILLLIFYIIAIWLSSIFTGYLIGNLIWKKLIKNDNNYLLIGLIGICLISVLKVLPVLGFLVSVVSILIGMGLILQLFKR